MGFLSFRPMSDSKQSQEEKAAEKRLAEAQEALMEAQEAAAEANQGLVAVKTRDVPRVVVKVRENQTVSDVQSGTLKTEGETLEMEGPDAIALMQLGYVTIQGEA